MKTPASKKRKGPLSNAERQAAYRTRHLHSVDGDGGRINLVVPVATIAALNRLAVHYGVTKRQMLESLMLDAENAVVTKLRGAAEKAYYAAANVTA